MVEEENNSVLNVMEYVLSETLSLLCLHGLSYSQAQVFEE